jgi:hypothetical protein
MQQGNQRMETHRKSKTLIDLEKLNTFGAQGCPACGRSFELGEVVVLARGSWEGQRYIHESEATFDRNTGLHYESRYYDRKPR